MQGSRPDRVGEQIRQELAQMLARDVHDPAIGLVTVTRVQLTPDLQLARVFYTQIGDDRAKRETVKALGRATSFLRRQLGARLRLRRVPEIQFKFDEGIERQARIEEILLSLEQERRERSAHDDPPADAPPTADAAESSEHDDAAPESGAGPATARKRPGGHS
jgi:ribosome-binding factor A